MSGGGEEGEGRCCGLTGGRRRWGCDSGGPPEAPGNEGRRVRSPLPLIIVIMIIMIMIIIIIIIIIIIMIIITLRNNLNTFSSQNHPKK